MNRRIAFPEARICAVAVAAALVLVGCSSADSKIYDSFKCAKVAMMSGRSAEARAASVKIEPYLKEIKEGQSQYLMRLSTKFTDDLELHRYSPMGAAKIISDTFESSTCQKLYR